MADAADIAACRAYRDRRRHAAVRRQGAAAAHARPAGTARRSTGNYSVDGNSLRPWLLAGGLTADNVARADPASESAGRRCLLRRRNRAGRQSAGTDRAHSSRPRATRNSRRRPGVTRSPNSFRTGPDIAGHFGAYGGRFVAETLMPLVLDLERAYDDAKHDPAFHAELDGLLKHYVGRPSPLYFAERLTAASGRREDLSQARGPQSHRRAQDQQLPGPDPARPAHGQDAHHRRDRRGPAWRGDGDGGGALRLPCVVYMGEVDIERQKPNVFRMKLLGAEVRARDVGLEHAEGCDERGPARLGRQCPRYVLHHRFGRGPASLSRDGARFPVRDRQRGARADLEARRRLPDLVVACVGGGSNAIGMFHPFLDDPRSRFTASRRRARASIRRGMPPR